MAIKMRIIYGCILLLTTSLFTHADDFSISNYIISRQNSGDSQLVDIKIGWVTINLTSLDQNLTNDQRITACNSRENYILDINNFRNMVNFYYDFISRMAGNNDQAIRQMSQLLTRIFNLNASNISNRNILYTQRINMDFFHDINLSNFRLRSANSNSEKKRCRKIAQRTNNAGSTNSATIGFEDFYSNPNDNVSCISNTGLALLLASFLEPWVRMDVQAGDNPLATINDHLALIQRTFFNRVFQRVLSSANRPTTSTSPESTSQINHEYDPFAFITTEDIIHFLNSTGADKDFVFATLLRSLSISFSFHLINRNVFSRAPLSTPEDINRNYPAADTMQTVYFSYVSAYLQSREVILPLNCSFDFNYMRQMSSDYPQLSPDFWTNLALTHQRLADEEPTRLFTRLSGTDTSDTATPEAPAIQQAVENPNTNRPNRAQRTITQLLRLNAQLNDRLNGVSSEQSSSSESCCICLEKKQSAALMPCQHASTCYDCANRLLQSNVPNCPMCRHKIEGILKLYFN
ncbi:RING-HC finger protein [Endozoicomonas euniceicola]|uniref:RING-type domain-containing protein n=1 Tax=Endozoicomonas euniceicola TaxID=1234143 RepID=A0ABY6GZ48_9GAMM|nr:RING-HC finger protein [Endozoicomonas euniceicola]UYM17296.1 hypothetical protein NX720_05060 [Endozoicomonas euniceicola]